MDGLIDYVLVAILVGVVGSTITGVVWTRRWARRYRPEGALADATLDANGRFALELPAGGPIDLYLYYSMQAARRSGGGVSYGMAMRLDVKREPASVGFRDGGATFEVAYEYPLGEARKPFGEVPLAEPIDLGPSIHSGLDRSRGMRLLRVPAGGRLVASGRAETRGLTTDVSFLLFAKPAR